MVVNDETNAAAVMADAAGSKAPAGRPPVLIVEDDRRVATLLQHVVEMDGYDAIVCTDGLAALSHIGSSGAPTLVLLDLMLPHRSGFQILEAIRSDDAGWAEVPVMILTGNGDEQQMIRGLDAGADDYLTKPFSPDELLARVRRLVRRRASSATRA